MDALDIARSLVLKDRAKRIRRERRAAKDGGNVTTTELPQGYLMVVRGCCSCDSGKVFSLHGRTRRRTNSKSMT